MEMSARQKMNARFHQVSKIPIACLYSYIMIVGMFASRIAVTLLLTSSMIFSQEKKEPEKKENKEEVKAPATVVREAVATIGGKTIPYTSRTGKLILKKDDGSPKAAIFHVSYIRKDTTDPAKRPVLFAFNGGPGSSAVWLHIGALGPRKIILNGDGTSAPQPPVRLSENPQSILDVTDLVFIDPVSTGYSRAEKDVKASDFHGLEEDIESVGDFIRAWITENKRWASPKYLLGESYGGIRAAGLADHLQSRYGMSLNGIVMLSTLLDFQTLMTDAGNDLPYQMFLPSYTAIALHHGVIKGDRDELLKEAREFSENAYATALLKGNAISAEEKKSVAEKLSALTGVKAELLETLNIRLDPARFRGELLASQKKVVGRFDGRVAWDDTNGAEPYPEYDPSYSLAYGAFSTAMLDYLGRDLGWQEDSPYEILTNKVQPWRYEKHGYTNLTPRLTDALRDNPKLRILIQCGYTDLATPPAGMTYSVNHMLDLPESLQKNISWQWYDAGHMFYLNPPDLKKMHDDLVKFIQE